MNKRDRGILCIIAIGVGDRVKQRQIMHRIRHEQSRDRVLRLIDVIVELAPADAVRRHSARQRNDRRNQQASRAFR